MSYCACPRCGSVLNCRTVDGKHVNDPCAVCAEPGRVATGGQVLVPPNTNVQELQIELSYTERRKRSQARQKLMRRNRSRPHAA